MKSARERLYSFCAECGPNVACDEDGCCATCGGTAVGSWLYDNSVALVVVPKKRRTQKKDGKK